MRAAATVARPRPAMAHRFSNRATCWARRVCRAPLRVSLNGDSPSPRTTAARAHEHAAPGGSDDGDSHGSGRAGTKRPHDHLEDLASKYAALEGRLDSLEGSLVNLLANVKRRAARPAAAAGVGPAGEAQDGTAGLADAQPGALPDEGELLGEGSDSDSGEHGGGIFDLKRLQASLSENINKGYLESVKHLRDMLMAYEWHLHGKELAERRGVALFERELVDRGMEVPFDVVSRLYDDPSALELLPDERSRLLARSIIQQAVDERYCSIYSEATATAKELARTGLKDVIPDSAGKVGGVIKDILPLPGFLKK